MGSSHLLTQTESWLLPQGTKGGGVNISLLLLVTMRDCAAASSLWGLSVELDRGSNTQSASDGVVFLLSQALLWKSTKELSEIPPNSCPTKPGCGIGWESKEADPRAS